ncbi:MAG: sugar phosphate nucleotidyltransferase [Acidimicrobiia bacterium]
MRALILAGGKGSRLRPFTFTIPKPLVPIGELPIIEILIRQLAAGGFERITISVGHLSGLIEAFCGDGSRFGASIDYLREDAPLGTVGCLSLMGGMTEDRLLLVNGDTLTDCDMASLHRDHDPGDAITIAANRRIVDVDFGVLDSDEAGLLVDYREKPTLSYQVSMGINVVSAWAIRRFVPPATRMDLPALVAAVMAAGERVRVAAPEAFWLDLGRMEDLEEGGRVFEADPSRFLPE